MTFTFQDYLITEALDGDPAEAMTQQTSMNSDNVVDLTTEVRKLMRSIVLAEPHTAEWDDPQSFTYLDLIEALEITEQVITNELSAHTNFQSPENQEGEMGQENQEDDYRRLFDSIGKEVKESVRAVFGSGMGGGESDRSILPRFVLQYSLVVDVLMDGLAELGPEQAQHVIRPVISAAKRTVATQEQSRGSVTSAENKQYLRQYSIARKQAIGNKKASSLTKQDRMRLKAALKDGNLQR